MGETRNKPRGRNRLKPADIGTFAAVLLAALGLNGAANFWRRRRERQAAEQERQAAAEQAAQLERKRAAGHETSSPRVGKIALVALALVAVAAIGHTALFLLFGFLESRAEQADLPISPLATAAQLPPEPRLQANPRADWLQVRATAEAVLHSYGQDGGAVRIPIDRAMDLLVQRGLPSRDMPPPESYDQAHQLESDGGQPPGVSGAQAPPGSGQALATPTPTAAAGATRSAP